MIGGFRGGIAEYSTGATSELMPSSGLWHTVCDNPDVQSSNSKPILEFSKDPRSVIKVDLHTVNIELAPAPVSLSVADSLARAGIVFLVVAGIATDSSQWLAYFAP